MPANIISGITIKVKLSLLFLAILASFSFSLEPVSITPQAVLNLINEDRKSQGLTELTLDPRLNLAALAKAQDMISKNYFAHISPEGTKPWDWINNLGYRYTYAGENLAIGYNNPHELVNSWMSSATHRANILSPNYSDSGLAIVSYGDKKIIVQMFGTNSEKVSLGN